MGSYYFTGTTLTVQNAAAFKHGLAITMPKTMQTRLQTLDNLLPYLRWEFLCLPDSRRKNDIAGGLLTNSFVRRRPFCDWQHQNKQNNYSFHFYTCATFFDNKAEVEKWKYFRFVPSLFRPITVRTLQCRTNSLAVSYNEFRFILRLLYKKLNIFDKILLVKEIGNACVSL